MEGYQFIEIVKSGYDLVQKLFVKQIKKTFKNKSIYIVNERNEVKTFTKFKGSRSKLVNAINRYYTQESENSSLQVLNFNLPQYFILSDDQQTVKPFTI